MYVLEPSTIGKVVLHTTEGPLDVELWTKQAPKATRNFLQLCMEGYYDNTIFHRIVKDFLIQGGDPTGMICSQFAGLDFAMPFFFFISLCYSCYFYSCSSLGTGTGGDSIYDAPFADEYNSRLRFSHRGLVACASFQKHQNGSQFFITLDQTPALNNKHTIFGKVRVAFLLLVTYLSVFIVQCYCFLPCRSLVIRCIT
jgi:peptidyl-prolyl cis-trans isomerase SDCCAG10